MADITVTAADVKALPGYIAERYDAGGAGSVGDTVYMATDGDIEEADGSAAGTAYAIGIVIKNLNNVDANTFVAGDKVEVVTGGRVGGFSGMTPGDVLYQSDTAGTLGDAAGTVSHKIARARSATVIWLAPEITEA